MGTEKQRRHAHMMKTYFRYDLRPRRTNIDLEWFKGSGPEAKQMEADEMKVLKETMRKIRSKEKEEYSYGVWSLPERIELVRAYKNSKFTLTKNKFKELEKKFWNGKRFPKRSNILSYTFTV